MLDGLVDPQVAGTVPIATLELVHTFSGVGVCHPAVPGAVPIPANLSPGCRAGRHCRSGLSVPSAGYLRTEYRDSWKADLLRPTRRARQA